MAERVPINNERTVILMAHPLRLVVLVGDRS